MKYNFNEEIIKNAKNKNYDILILLALIIFLIFNLLLHFKKTNIEKRYFELKTSSEKTLENSYVNIGNSIVKNGVEKDIEFFDNLKFDEAIFYKDSLLLIYKSNLKDVESDFLILKDRYKNVDLKKYSSDNKVSEVVIEVIL